MYHKGDVGDVDQVKAKKRTLKNMVKNIKFKLKAKIISNYKMKLIKVECNK